MTGKVMPNLILRVVDGGLEPFERGLSLSCWMSDLWLRSTALQRDIIRSHFSFCTKRDEGFLRRLRDPHPQYSRRREVSGLLGWPI